MSKSVTQRKPKRRCDTCFKINPPDAKNCLNCQRVFNSFTIHSAVPALEDSAESSDLFFNETEINLLMTLGNLSATDDKKLTNPATAMSNAVISKEPDRWGNHTLPTTRIPLFIHNKEESKSGKKYIQLVIGLITVIFVILLFLYLLK